MKKSIVILTIILMLVVFAYGARQNATSSTSSGWSQLISVEGRFKVMMPGEYSQETSTEKYGSESFKSHIFSLTNKEYRLAVSYLDFDKSVSYPDEAQSILNEVCKRLGQEKGKIKDRKEVYYHDYPGVECRVEFKDGAEWMRATVVNERLYRVTATSLGSKKLSDESIRFFDSFSIAIPPRPTENLPSTDNVDDPASPNPPGIKKLILLNSPRPGYTEEARHQGVTGTIIVQAVFRADGLITDIRIVRGLPYGLNEEAIKAVRKIRFTPAERNGKKIDFRGTVKVTFTLV